MNAELQALEDELLELIQNYVSANAPWSEKVRNLHVSATDAERIALYEFIAWFDAGGAKEPN